MRLLRTVLPVVTGIPDSMNPISHPWSSTCPSFREEERHEIF